MLDRMTMKARIDAAMIPVIVSRKSLLRCQRGGSVYWQTSAYGKFDAMFITIEGGELDVKMSLHKHWAKAVDGRLDNSGVFTMRDAEDALLMTIDELCLSPTQTRVTYYEVGVNLQMQYDPLEYIRRTTGCVGKEMFIDANYEKDRQRTTAKTRNMRKVHKIYDKTFEASEKGHDVAANTLRCETIYRHQNVLLSMLFDKQWQRDTMQRFADDWQHLTFERMLTGRGVKESQLSHARELLRLGREEWLRLGREQWRAGLITKKQWETKRNFARSWPDMMERFRMEPSELETEYRNKLHTAMASCLAAQEKE